MSLPEIKVTGRVLTLSQSTLARNPNLGGGSVSSQCRGLRVPGKESPVDLAASSAVGARPSRIRQSSKPLMNHTELRCQALLESRGVVNIMQQAITLRLDPPFKSYRPDLAYLGTSGLVLVEVKGEHRFKRAGIAKAALAAKTYPQFRFELFEWDSKTWKESVLSA